MALTIGQAIRNIRTRLDMTQGDFAEMLGSQRNSIRRYEAGLVKPGFGVLGRLLNIAAPEEKEEKEAIVQEWNVRVGSPQTHVPDAADAVDPFTGALQIADGEEFFARLNQTVNALAWRTLSTLAAADDSLREIFGLWSQNKNDERAVRIFREVATLLRDRLAGLTPKKKQRLSRRSKAAPRPKRRPRKEP